MKHEPLTLLTIGHLRWDHVWQRPQQLMTRFARRARVIYVDPAEIAAADAPRIDEQPDSHGVRRLQPVFPVDLLDTPGHNYRELWLKLLPTVLAEAGSNTIVWVSSPLLSYLVAAALPHVRFAVYDCMDDLASFKDGSALMREREEQLLRQAELLFTGGLSMYEARKMRHPRAYCFPSGVDVAHFSRAEDQATREPAAIAGIPHPRLGYFGVLDERIDWPLIAQVAEQRPDWHWLLVGPTAKVRPEDLPQAPNIHYLGQQQYTDLPAYLKGFDIATMPFALNEATRFISPTKTPEYLAGGKSVVSSSVPDVAARYGNIVYLADGPDAWIAAVESALAAAPAERAARNARAIPLLEQSSWDGVVDRMWELIAGRLTLQAQHSLEIGEHTDAPTRQAAPVAR